MIWWLAAVSLFVAYIFYNQWTWIHAYWDFKCVPGPSPLPLIGNILPTLLGRRSLGELCLRWSRRYGDSPLVGFYVFMTPYVILNRADYVVTVLKENFFHFSDRFRPRSDGSHRLLDSANGATWKLLRSKMAPIFTVEKIKASTPLIKTCSDRVLKHLEENISRDVSLKDIAHTYMVALTASIVYGIDLDGTSNRLEEFSDQCDKIIQDSLLKTMIKTIDTYLPRLANYFKIRPVSVEQELFFKKALELAFRERKASGAKRNDIVQLLLELKEKGVVDAENMNDPENGHLVPPQNIGIRETVEVTEEQLASQALVFLTTGFETVSGALGFALVDLCQNPDMADRLVREIDEVLGRHGDLTYDALQEMRYLEMCIMESLRLHPLMPMITRCCTRNYTFDNGLQIPKHTMVAVPVLAVHGDPNNYEEPEKYRPERFTTPPLPGTYLGFGDGFRSCIAKNLAMIEMKMMLAQLLRRYEVKLSRRTVLPPVTANRDLICRPVSPIYFSMTKRSRA